MALRPRAGRSSQSLAAGITVFHPSDEAYGADKVCLEIVEALRSDRPVAVWLPMDVAYPERRLSSSLESRGVSVRWVRLPIIRRSYLSLRRLPRLLLRTMAIPPVLVARASVICYLNTSATLLVAPILRLCGRRVILHMHETWEARERLLLGGLARCCHEIIAVSHAVRDGLPKSLHGRCAVIYNGFDEPHSGPSSREKLRSFIGAGDSDNVALLASRWTRGKGIEVILDAWSHAAPPDLHLVILGGPPPVGEPFDVRGAIKARPNMDRVVAIGEAQQVGDWLDACDAVLVPSTKPDSLPTIAIEGMAKSRAVYASKTGGLPEIVADGVTGRLFPPGSQEAWETALRGLSGDKLVEFGRAGRKAYLEKFTRERFKTSLRAALQTVEPAPEPPTSTTRSA